ncbi:ABC transporter ATPase [Wenyingzhuangia sp. 2_MG-2023]|uniref:ABC transporter ATPase n=1 Tax=Wenyingzhuangia sp. 2_MG-2023 TaxID=3062639 RepID=UPI0026E1A8D9|nr:ABC transporter ATPase [Wenyingzhuangia sp. 2_MG-2023]MDO6738342.1 ABC transporter ATPase [Wenyingzhuangia sp. 2_MG-2023]
MLVDFNQLENNAKIFLYPSSKKFYPELLEQIKTRVDDFVQQWTEINEIEAGYEIKYQRFIIIAINPTKPITTHIIDELVSFIFKLQLDFDIELLDKLNVCFKQGEFVQYKDVKEFKKLIKNKSVNTNTIVFDNLINTKEELDSDWELPAEDTWYGRMF